MSNRRVLVPLVVILVAITILAFLVFRPFILTFIVAVSVSLLLAPLHRKLTRWLRQRPGLAAALLVLAVTLVILIPFSAAAGILGNQALLFWDWARVRLDPASLRGLMDEIVTEHAPTLGEWLHVDENTLPQIVSRTLSGLAGGFNQLVQRALARLTSAAFEFFLFVLMLFFLLRDGPSFRTSLQGVSPLSEAQEQAISSHLERTVKGVLVAMIVVPLAQGVMAFLGFLIFGVPAPLLWSVVVVLAALVPILGSPLGWVPAVGYLFVSGETWQWVGMLLYGLLGISAVDNVIKPLVLKGSARIHPLLGFLSILGGIMAFGPMGFLVGPVALSLVLSAVRIYRSDIVRLRPATRPAVAPSPPPAA